MAEKKVDVNTSEIVGVALVLIAGLGLPAVFFGWRGFFCALLVEGILLLVAGRTERLKHGISHEENET